MARPPVCKLMDYGKFKYESALKARESRKNQAQTVIKEIKLRPKIDPHDYGTKKGHVERFLKQGDKVKVTIMFRGREQSRPELGFKLLQRLAGDIEELGFVESSPKQDGRNMIMVIGPRDQAEANVPERAEPTATSAAQQDAKQQVAANRASPPQSAPVAGHTPARQSARAVPETATDAEPETAATKPAPARPAASAAPKSSVPTPPTPATPPASRPAAAPKPAAPRTTPASAGRPGPAGGSAPKPTAPRGTAAAARPGTSAPGSSAPKPGPTRRAAEGSVPTPRAVAADNAASADKGRPAAAPKESGEGKS